MTLQRRRGEGQFVAQEVGLLHDPKLLGLARALRVRPAEAYGMLGAWRELVLTRGSSPSGEVKGYTRDDVASFLGWPGKTVALFSAFKAAGFMSMRRRVLCYPGWAQTPTGYYACRRAAERQRWHDRQSEIETPTGASAETPRRGAGASTEPPRRNGHEERKDSTERPPVPPSGGVSAGAERWELFKKTYPKPIDRDETIPLLGALSDGDWEVVEFALREGIPLSLSDTQRKRLPNGRLFIKRQDFLKFEKQLGRKKADEARKAEEKAHPTVKPEPKTGPASREEAVEHVLSVISLPGVKRLKEKLKAEFIEKWGPPAPWEPAFHANGTAPTEVAAG